MTDRDRLIELVCDKIQDGHCIGHCNYPPCNQCREIACILNIKSVVMAFANIGTQIAMIYLI